MVVFAIDQFENIIENSPYTIYIFIVILLIGYTVM